MKRASYSVWPGNGISLRYSCHFSLWSTVSKPNNKMPFHLQFNCFIYVSIMWQLHGVYAAGNTCDDAVRAHWAERSPCPTVDIYFHQWQHCQHEHALYKHAPVNSDLTNSLLLYIKYSLLYLTFNQDIKIPKLLADVKKIDDLLCTSWARKDMPLYFRL